MAKFDIAIVKHLYDYSKRIVATIYCEETTDVLYIKPWGEETGFTVMLDPETGLPLTNAIWHQKYNKE